MAFRRVCAQSDIGAGELTAFFLEGSGGAGGADASGTLGPWTGSVRMSSSRWPWGASMAPSITFANHMWSFDATTGKGISNPSCQLEQYTLKVDDGEVFVDTEASAEATR